MGYVFASGKTVYFIGGQYATESETEIKELTECCKAGNPCFYIDQDNTTIDSEALSPVAALTLQIRAQILAEIAAANSTGNDRGNTVSNGKLEGIATSANVLGLQGNSNSDAEVMSAPKVTVNLSNAVATKL